MLEPVGFWSYARHDDAHSDGHLSQLRVIIGKAIGLRFGGEVTLWQDIAAIPFGADWAQTIDHTVGQTTFFVPIVTPRFLKSRHCHEEYLAFRQRMRDLGRNDLVFPIHYVDVDDLRPEDTLFGDDLDALRGHQWIDFRPLLDVDPRSTEVRIWAGALAKAILQAMRRQAPRAVSGRSAGETPEKAPDLEELIDNEDAFSEQGHAAAQEHAAGDVAPVPDDGEGSHASEQGGPGLIRRFTPPPAGGLFKDDQWVGGLAIAPDGRTALATYADRTLKLWDLTSGLLLRELAGHWLMVDSVSIAPDGRTALSGSTDWRLRQWDIASGQTLRKLKGHRGAVYGVAIAPDGRTALSGSRDKTLKLWDLASGQPLRTFAGHTDWVRSVTVARDGKTGFSASRDGTARQWDLGTGATLQTYTGHTGAVRAVAITPDGGRLLTASEDRSLKLWDVETGRCVRTLVGHTGSVACVAIAPDGRAAASGSDDATIRLWDLASGQELRCFTGHKTIVSAVAFTADGRTVLSGSHDATLILWSLA